MEKDKKENINTKSNNIAINSTSLMGFVEAVNSIKELSKEIAKQSNDNNKQ